MEWCRLDSYTYTCDCDRVLDITTVHVNILNYAALLDPLRALLA